MASTESMDPVADADRRVERAKASLKSRMAMLEHRLGEVRERVDLVAHIRRHPLPAAAIALGLGMLAARRPVPALPGPGSAAERTLAGTAVAALGALAVRLLRELAIGQLSDGARRWWLEHGGAPGEHAPERPQAFFDD